MPTLGFMGSQPGHPRAQIPPRNMLMYFYMLLYCLYKVRKENAHVYTICPQFGVSEPMGSTPGGPGHPNPPVRGQSPWGWHAKNSHLPIAMREKIDVTKFEISEHRFAYRSNGLPMGSQHGHLGAQITTRRTWTKQMLFYMPF